jgi:hypothetical protein
MRDEPLGIGGELNLGLLLPLRNNSPPDGSEATTTGPLKEWCNFILLPLHEALPICS